MLKILQVMLYSMWTKDFQIYKLGWDRVTRDQIANICWIIEKEREFQINMFLSLSTHPSWP